MTNTMFLIWGIAWFLGANILLYKVCFSKEKSKIKACPVCGDTIVKVYHDTETVTVKKFGDEWEQDNDYTKKQCNKCGYVYDNSFPTGSNTDDYFSFTTTVEHMNNSKSSKCSGCIIPSYIVLMLLSIFFIIGGLGFFG